MKALSKPLYTNLGVTRAKPPEGATASGGHLNQTASCAQFFVKGQNGADNGLYTAGNLLLAKAASYSVRDAKVDEFIEKYAHLRIIYSDFLAYRNRLTLGAEHVRVEWINDANDPEVAKSYNEVHVVEKPGDGLESDPSQKLTISLYLPDFYARLARERRMEHYGNPEVWEKLHGQEFEEAITQVADTPLCSPLLSRAYPPGLDEATLAQPPAPKLKRQSSKLMRMIAELKINLPARARTISEQSTDASNETKGAAHV